MDDELPVGVWSLDPDTRSALRLDRVRRLVRERDWVDAVVEIEELLDEEPDNTEALFLLGEAMLESGDPAVAAEAYGRQVELTGGDAPTLTGLAVARFETCDLVGAVEAAREAVRLDAANAEAHWYLGLSLERLPGGATEAVRAMSAARQLDPESFPAPLRIEDRKWHGLVTEAVRTLHPALQEFWNGVPVRLERWPDLDELRRHDPPIPPTVACMYVGDPPEEDDPFDVRPSGLRLFRSNLERSRDLGEVVEQLASALQTEGLDWLGLSDPSELDT